MPRSKGGTVARKSHKKIIKQAKGYFSRRKNIFRVAVQAVDREGQVALLALGRDAGGRPAAHHVDDDDGHLGGHRQADAFGHQRQARASGGRQRGHAAVGGADDHVHRGQLVLGLPPRAAAP
mgnify:CR=1 FL=1